MPYTGELAALITAVLWAITSMFFTSASRRIGSYWLNKLRISLGIVLLGFTLFVTTGDIFPSNASNAVLIYLGISGIIGLAIGDSLLFRAFVIIGARLSLVIFTTAPIIAAVFAWFILGETLGFYAIIGITITVAGVAWVSAERSYENDQTTYADKGSKRIGILLALGGAAGQAIGLVLAKAGMSEGMAPLPATFVRMLAAGAAIWIFSLITGDIRKTGVKYKDIKALFLALGGSICGPYLGVWMSLVAVKYTETGVASAIIATVPIMIIPLVVIFYKEKVSLRAILGAIITTAGVIILFLE
jgi:drug/metabolite transporter (DMT)-like permease